MKGVRFWGTRGSLPVALTSAGLANKLRGVLRAARGQPLDTDADIERLLASLPFFVPAFIPGNRVIVYGSHRELEMALRRQQEPPSFPVSFDTIFEGRVEFVHLEPGVPQQAAGMTVTTMLQRHTGDSYGYRFESEGKALVYTTDSEHPLADPAHTERFVHFFRDADLVIFDAMYSLADAISVKADWGHSSNVVAVELCQLARARRLCLFHHEPVFDDAAIEAMLAETRRLEEITRGAAPLQVSAAYDGLEILL